MTACTGKSDYRRDDIHTDDYHQYMALPPGDCLRSDFKVVFAKINVLEAATGYRINDSRR